jgi:hypothetical protein
VESLSEKYKIEELARELMVGMDKIVYLDNILRVCGDDNYHQYLHIFELEFDDHLKTKDMLITNLTDYIKEESEGNHPINMSYRQLLKVLKE